MTESPRPRVAVIVVTWNSRDVIAECLESVRSSDFDGTLELMVVDNASSDETVDIVARTAPEARVVQTGRNAGYAAAINEGMRVATNPDAYLLLNPDLRVETGTIRILNESLRSPGVGITVPRLVDEAGGLRYSLRREPTVSRAWGEALLGGRRAGRITRLGEVETRPEVYEAPSRADWATGAAMMIQRACVDTVGHWDETYFLYSEETDFALRARDAGFSLAYVPTARAVHFEGESHQSPALFSLLERNRVKLYRSRHGAVSTAGFWAGVVVGDAIRFLDPTRRAALVALLGNTNRVASPS